MRGSRRPVSALLFLAYARIGIVAARRHPAAGHPSGGGARRCSGADPGAPELRDTLAQHSGRAADDPLTQPLVLIRGGR